VYSLNFLASSNLWYVSTGHFSLRGATEANLGGIVLFLAVGGFCLSSQRPSLVTQSYSFDGTTGQIPTLLERCLGGEDRDDV